MTLAEAKPYLDYRQREVLFREGVLSFLGVREQEVEQKRDAEAYEAALKMQEKASGE